MKWGSHVPKARDIEISQKSSMPGSNRRPSACKADVITNYTNRTKKSGDGRHRSCCLSHAKRALYHLSYTPFNICMFFLFYVGDGGICCCCINALSLLSIRSLCSLCCCRLRVAVCNPCNSLPGIAGLS